MIIFRQAALVGMFATLSMDLLTVFAYRLGLVAPLQPALVGRWFVTVARAQPFHTDIAQLPPFSHEMALVFPVHDAIGITLACVYLWLTARLGLPAASFGGALGFGLCTNLLPWLLMFPSMGYGVFGAHGPAGTRLFVSSLTSHACYGLGLWLAARWFVHA